MEKITVEKVSETEVNLKFSVEVGLGATSTEHRVTVKKEDYRRLSPGDAGSRELVKESFRFLLEREPRESILSRFELLRIGDYFPEYEKEIKSRLREVND